MRGNRAPSLTAGLNILPMGVRRARLKVMKLQGICPCSYLTGKLAFQIPRSTWCCSHKSISAAVRFFNACNRFSSASIFQCSISWTVWSSNCPGCPHCHCYCYCHCLHWPQDHPILLGHVLRLLQICGLPKALIKVGYVRGIYTQLTACRFVDFEWAC